MKIVEGVIPDMIGELTNKKDTGESYQNSWSNDIEILTRSDVLDEVNAEIGQDNNDFSL